MKKTLILLPFAALILAGCGGGDQELKPLDPNIPEGGEKIDTDNAEQRSKLVDKIVNNAKVSYNGAKVGFSVEGEVKANNVDIENSDLHVQVADAGFTFKLTAVNLDKKASEWKVAAELSNIKAKVTLDGKDVGGSRKEFIVSDISLGAYLDGGTAYADLSNAKLAALADDVVSKIFAAEELPTIKQYVSMALGKSKVKDVFKLFGLDDSLKIPELSDKDFDQLKAILPEGLEELKKGKDLPQVEFIDYKESGLAATLTYAHSDESSNTNEYNPYKYSSFTAATGNVVFNNKGELAKVYLAENINESSSYNGKLTSAVKVSAEVGATIKLGVTEISMPNFSEFVENPLVAMLTQKIPSASYPKPTPAPQPDVGYVE